MNKRQFDAIKRRVGNLAPGGWTSRPVKHGYRQIHREIDNANGVTIGTIYGPSLTNAIFVVNAPEDVRALIAEVERLQAEVERLKEEGFTSYAVRGAYDA